MKSLMSQTIRGVNRTLFTGRFIPHRYYSILLPGTKNKLIGDDSQSTSEHRDSNEGIDQRSIKMFNVEANTLASRFRSKQYQLQCIGGNAMHKNDLHPQSMVCVNIGVDDRGAVNWHYMVPQLNNSVSLSGVTVAFEGITPGSPLVRPGSAVVRYHLLFKNRTTDVRANDNEETLISIICTTIFASAIIAFVLWMATKDKKPDVSKSDKHDYTQDQITYRSYRDEKYRSQTPTIIINSTESDKSVVSNSSII